MGGVIRGKSPLVEELSDHELELKVVASIDTPPVLKSESMNQQEKAIVDGATTS